MRRSIPPLPLRSACLCAVLAACSTAPPAETPSGPRRAGFAAPADFPGAAAILHGFDPRDAEGAWRAGDEVLFGLRLWSDGRARHWLLHLRLTEPLARASAADEVPAGQPLPPVDWELRVNGEEQHFASRLCRGVASVHDAGGELLGRSESLLPRDFLASGFAIACVLAAAQQVQSERDQDPDGFYRDVDVRPFAAATVAAMALLQVVQDDRVLAPLLWEVVQKPSLWSLVTHLGAEVVLHPRFHASAEVPSPVPSAGAPAWKVPLLLLVNGEPALDTELFVVPSEPPYALCGGVVGATARCPGDPGREFSLLLLAARRGPTPAARPPAASSQDETGYR